MKIVGLVHHKRQQFFVHLYVHFINIIHTELEDASHRSGRSKFATVAACILCISIGTLNTHISVYLSF